MRVVVQRVTKASVSIEGKIKASIGYGLLVLLGIEDADNDEDIDWLVRKISQLRIFNDDSGAMNRSLEEIGGEVLVISQFTLMASLKKGNRPSYIRASGPEKAIPLYEKFICDMSSRLGKAVGSGKFGADMQVSLLNDGPVTIVIDTKNKDF
ncbi:MAG: D-aminoacyl-tRNA deacylase [Prolixibacteraceae bacterium]